MSAKLPSLVGLALVVGTTLVACATDDTSVPLDNGGGTGPGSGVTPKGTFVVRPGAIQADATVARDAIVVPGSITLPFAGHEALLQTLAPGAIFYGDRAPGAPESNALGFNVRVLSLGQEGDRLVIRTESATMQDLFETADFELPLDAAALIVNDADIQLLAESSFSGSVPMTFNFGDVWKGKLGSGTTQASGKASISGGINATFTPRGSIRYESRGWSLPDLDVNIGCGLDLVFSACAKAEGKLLSGKHASDGLIAFDGKTTTVPAELSLPSVTIPAPSPPPLVLTMKAQPKLFCGLEYSRSVGVAATYRNAWDVSGRFGLASGSPFGNATFTSRGGQMTWEFALQGGLKLKCGVEIKMGIYLYESLGAYFTLKPGAELGVSGTARLSGGTGPTTAGQVQACAGFDAVLEGKYGLEASIGWIDYNREWPIGTPLRLPLPFPVNACVQNYTPADGCAGKADGLYCSDIDSKASYSCAGGSLGGGGTACPDGQYCQSQTGEMGAKATPGPAGGAACGTTMPRPAPLTLSYCPSAPEPLK